MAASKKAIENANRLRYIRALERFHNSIVSYLSSTHEVNKEAYNKKVANALKVFNRVQEVQLYKGDYQELQKLVAKMIDYSKEQKDITEIKTTLLYMSNQLDKTKNAKKYKKEKHSKSHYKDWE